MYIGISDSSGLLYAYYPGSNGLTAVSGDGSNAISFSGSYADVQAIINNLTYVAAPGGGTDDIHYDVWNQAGVETTGDVPVTIQPVAASDTWLGTVSADWNIGANWSSGAPPASGDSVAIPAGTPFDASLSNATLSGETITLSGSGSQPATVNFSDVTLDSLLAGTGTIDASGTLTIGASGTLALQNASTIASAASAATVVNDGTITSASGDRLFIDNGGTAGGNPTLVNNGVITAAGGEIAMQLNQSGAQPEMLQNAGSIVIADGGSIWMNGTLAGGDIAFNGTGALTLQQGMAFAAGATVTGFGPGDQIDLFDTAAGKGGTLSFANGTLDVTVAGTLVQAIPIAGSYTLGNFEHEAVSGDGNADVIAYVPNGGPSGIASPDIVAPSADTVAQGATLALNGVSIDAPGTTQAGVTIIAGSGTLFMNGATGSGTSQISVGLTSISQVNADLASLTYVPAAGASNDVLSITTLPPAPVATTRAIPVTISGGGGATETWTGAVSSDWNTAGNWSGDAVPTSGDTAIIPYGAPNTATLSNATLSGETVILQGSSTGFGRVDFNNVTLDSSLQTATDGQVSIGGTLAIGTQGTVLSDSSGTLSLFGTAETVINNGQVLSTGGGNVNFSNGPSSASNPATFINNGSISADGGGVDLSSSSAYAGAPPIWEMQNNGSIDIVNNGRFLVNGTVSGGDIALSGSASLGLEQGSALAGATVSGFGPGDHIDLYGAGAVGTVTAFSNGTLYVGTGGANEAIPLIGTYTLGNFENELIAYPNNPSIIAYAPGGGTSGLVGPEIVAPAQDTVSQGSTLMLNDVSLTAKGGGAISNTGTYNLAVSASGGTLYMNGARGSGSGQLLVSATAAQLNADLASLEYVPAAGTTGDAIAIDVNGGGQTSTLRYIPVTVQAGSSGPAISEPSSESVAAGGTVAVSGSYSDSFAQGNPGQLFLGISDGSGALYATDASGNPLAGSGSNSISVRTDYTDLNAALASLRYVAGGGAGSDSISFDIWNQAGVQTTDVVPVTVTTGGGGGATETWTGAVSSDWNTAGNWSGGGVPTSGDTAIIAGSTGFYPTLSNATLNNEPIILDQEAQPQGDTLDLNGVTLGAGSVLEIQNPQGNSQNIATINLGGTVTVDAGATIVSNDSVVYQGLSPAGAGAVLVNDGTIANTAVSFENGGTVFNNGVFENQAIGAATLINAGTILADNAGASISGTVQGGTVELANTGGITVDGTLSGSAVDFNGPGDLRLQQQNALTNGTALNNFGQGDEILLSSSAFVQNTTLAFSNDTLMLQQNGSVVATVPFNGSYTLGNFVIEPAGGSPFVFAYAASGQFSGLISPDIAAPAQAAAAQGGTLSLGGVAINNTTSFDTSLQISAPSGTLTMNGATGSGTNTLTVTGSNAQVNADLASLTYTPDAGTSSDAVQISANIDFPSAAAAAERFVPISVTGSSGPTLTEPASEAVAPGGTVAVSGSYSDSFAQGNPGQLYLGISDSSGTLSATDASGQAVAGSGSNSIGVSTDYVDVNAILASLHYTAGSSAGSDAIQFQVWNQAGVDTTGATSITVGTAMTAADVAGPGAMSSAVMAPVGSASAGLMLLSDVQQQPIGTPLTLPH